jgi:HK97 family phage portal protein
MTTKQKRKPVRKKPTKQALSPTTQPPDPEQSSHRGMIFLPQRSAGVVVNEDTGMTQSTVWACIKVISESLAGMPWLVGRKLKDGTIEPTERADLDWLLNYQPNPEIQSFAFREVLWQWALGWGNGYAEIERDFAGNVVNMWQLHPGRVRLVRDQRGDLFYEVYNDRRPPSYIEPRNMFHLMGPSPDGLVGWSVIRMHARTIGLAIAQEENASSFNANDSTPGGVLEHPMKLGDVARKNLEESWNRRHKGPNNRRTVAILEEGMKWSQTGSDPEDAKLVEQMQLTPAMICRIFGVPPHMVADLSRATFSNIENQDLDFVRNCLRPWAERGEAEADVKLFGRNNQARLVTFIDLSERERGDTAAQTNHIERMLFCGFYTINEARKYRGMPGIGPDGDRRFIQSAMIPIEDAGKNLDNAPAKTPPEDSTDENPPPEESGDDDTLATIQDRTMAVLIDACRRMLKRENDAKNLDGDALGAWLFKHRDYCKEILLPASGVLAACLKSPPEAVDVAVSLFLTKHLSNGRDGTPESKAIELREYLRAASAVKGAA